MRKSFDFAFVWFVSIGLKENPSENEIKQPEKTAEQSNANINVSELFDNDDSFETIVNKLNAKENFDAIDFSNIIVDPKDTLSKTKLNCIFFVIFF